jgi:hypothetical protein
LLRHGTRRLVWRYFYPAGRDLLFLPLGMYPIAIVQAAYTESVSEKISKAMADAFYTALAAFLIGVCLAGSMKRIDGFPMAGAVFCGAFAIFEIVWTRRAVQRLLTAKYTTSEAANRSARQLLLFCVGFASNSATFGAAVMRAGHGSYGGSYSFSKFVFAIVTCVSFFSVHREARRLTSALV